MTKRTAFAAVLGGLVSLAVSACGSSGTDDSQTGDDQNVTGKSCAPENTLHCADGYSVTTDGCASPRYVGAPTYGRCVKSTSTKNACEEAGGSCVALSPGSCKDGTVADATTHSCGGGLGVECCMPSTPPTCATLTCASGHHCCSGPLNADPSLNHATCQPDGTACPL